MQFQVALDVVRKLKFNDQGLIPAIVQEEGSGEVLMLAYQNQEALIKTLESGLTWFYSRSRQKLWNKGATSGHYQHVQAVYYDCDADTLLIKVIQDGHACHKGFHSCFHNRFDNDAAVVIEEDDPELNGARRLGDTLGQLNRLIKNRKANLPEGSYTTYLFQKGLDKILKKVGEETAEVIIAAKNKSRMELTYEAADLFYHLIVLLVEQELTLDEIEQELSKRRK